jgi:DNA-binding NarL/FixJ family response regulator
VRDADADVVIVDVRMPGGGPDAVREVLAAGLSTPPAVVALSAQVNLSTVVAMVGAGATGYLAKGRVGLTLPDLVSRCAAGEVVLAVSCAGEALRQLTRAARMPDPA